MAIEYDPNERRFTRPRDRSLVLAVMDSLANENGGGIWFMALSIAGDGYRQHTPR
ncbi:MAG: hypothetical protein R3348_02690 [Xanthomonadales bacterium]|nr:hypothetical protein [Xanthomonadales bacterium]